MEHVEHSDKSCLRQTLNVGYRVANPRDAAITREVYELWFDGGSEEPITASEFISGLW